MNMKCKLLIGPLVFMLALSGVCSAVVVSAYAGQVLPNNYTQAAMAEEGTDIGQNTSADSGISMSVTYGFDNRARGGRYVPVDVTFSNTGNEDFSGNLRLLTMESDYDIYSYEFPADISAGERSETHVYIPIGNRADQLFVSLNDESGNQLINRRLRLKFNLDVPELFVGVLSDTPEKMVSWEGVGIDYGMLRTAEVYFDARTFPENEMGLDMLDVLVISNFRIRDLSTEQSRVLIDWVRSGGTMILGTGERADDTLGRFAPELLEESYDPPTIREVDMGDAYALENPDDATLTIPCLEFSLSGGDVLFSDEEQALVASVVYGRGTIAVAAYDFADIDEFSRRNPSYLDDLLTRILGEDKIISLAQAVYSGNSDQYWSVRDMINTGNVRQLPNVNLYTMEIVIYIFLAGIGIYVFLRQRDMTDYYRRLVVALSLLFTVIIYFMGMKTRFTDAFFTYARFVETNYDSISETTYMNIRAPYNRSYQTILPSEYAVKPVTRSFYNDENAPRFTGSEDYRVAVSFEDDQTVISIRDVSAFEPRYFQLDQVVENADGIGFDGEAEVDGGNLSGSITNYFNEKVEDCALLFNHKLVCLGDLEPGETVILDDLELLEYPRGASYQVASYLSGESGFEETDINNDEYVNAVEKTNLLRFYLDNHMPYYTTPSIRLVGFTAGGEVESMLKSRSVHGITLVSSTIAVYPSDDEMLYRSVLAKTPDILGGNYDVSTNSLFGIDPVTLKYSLGSDVEVESLNFDYVSDAFTEQMEASGIRGFSGGIYFYNQISGTYDEMDLIKVRYTSDELKPYLAEDNTITIRYVFEDMTQYNWNILLPMLNIVGREY